VNQNWYVDKDMNGEQLDKFSSAEDDHKLKYMQKSYGVAFFDSPCISNELSLDLLGTSAHLGILKNS